MEEADEPSNCSFYHHFTHLNCTGHITSIKHLDKSQQTVLLSEIQLLSSQLSLEFTICKNHESHIDKLLFNRNRVKTCQIPAILSTHNFGGKAVKADRHLSVEQILIIQKRTGTVLPVNTGNFV